MKKTIIILVILSVFLSSCAFAQNQKIEAPETIEEARGWLEKVWEIIKKNLPGIINKIWKEQVLPVWQKMFEWFRQNCWVKIEGLFRKEVEKRKPMIEEEFKKEKEELKEELPKTGKSLWEKFKELIK